MRLEQALKAKLPMIGITTDDPINLEDVLKSIADDTLIYVEKNLTDNVFFKSNLFWSDNTDLMTSDLYKKLMVKKKVLIFVNCKPNQLVFNAGAVLPPKQLMVELCSHYSNDPLPLVEVLKGLSIKTAADIIQLASVTHGNVTPKSVRSMRMALGQSVQGLYPVDTELGYYEPHKQLMEWLGLNMEYFLNPKHPAYLAPRGVLLDGPPGTGKTMAARAIAHALGVPLYRLDIATTLNRYIGESEGRMSQSLSLLEREAPCVVLFDEVEKIFTGDADNGVIERMMSQLLWWLQEHKARVLTVMTTNDKHKIVPELYRPGRIDKVFHVDRLTAQEAREFYGRLLMKLLPKKPTLAQLNALKFVSHESQTRLFTPSEITTQTYDLIKSEGWLK